MASRIGAPARDEEWKVSRYAPTEVTSSLAASRWTGGGEEGYVYPSRNTSTGQHPASGGPSRPPFVRSWRIRGWPSLPLLAARLPLVTDVPGVARGGERLDHPGGPVARGQWKCASRCFVPSWSKIHCRPCSLISQAPCGESCRRVKVRSMIPTPSLRGDHGSGQSPQIRCVGCCGTPVQPSCPRRSGTTGCGNGH